MWGCLFVLLGMVAAALSLPNVVVAALLVFGLALLITQRRDVITQ